jgi:excisionase family DNA binding protein
VEYGLYDANRAAEYLRLSRTSIYELMRAGKLRSIKIGAARRIPRQALDDFIAEQEAEQAPTREAPRGRF